MDLFFARQPIFDREDRVVGYELLYRPRADSEHAGVGNVAAMASQVIVSSVLDAGVEKVTNGTPAWVNVPRELLVSGALEALDPRQVVIEVLESVEPDDEVVAACRRLTDAGYRLALDDVVFRPGLEPLLRVAHMVKVDVLTYSPAELRELVSRLRQYDVRLVAEKVETRLARDICRQVGFDYFQGYFFCRPQSYAKRSLPMNWLSVLRLLNMVQDLDVSDSEIEEAFRTDLPLTYKLLRMVNSAGVGGRGIESVGQALRLLGRGAVYRWLALLMVSQACTNGGLQYELLRHTLVRARLCELLAERTGGPVGADAAFLAGLLSTLDALLGVSMEQALEGIALSTPLRDALLGRTGPIAGMLELAAAYQQADWNLVERSCRDCGLDTSVVAGFYLDALVWAQDRMPPANP